MKALFRVFKEVEEENWPSEVKEVVLGEFKSQKFRLKLNAGEEIGFVWLYHNFKSFEDRLQIIKGVLLWNNLLLSIT